MAIYLGTAGWGVPKTYDAEVPGPGTHLQRYARVLACAEINTSFYRPHRQATYARWAASVPDAFRFSVKLPKTVTHERRLADCEDLLDRFLDESAGLGAKRGVLLAQLPPSFAFERRRAETFFTTLLRKSGGRIAYEPRHASWFDTEASHLLHTLGIVRVAADPAPVPGAGDPGGAASFAYFRLHGSPKIYYSDYDGPRLRAIAATIAARASGGGDVWCIFDNTAAFAALGNARAVQCLMPSMDQVSDCKR